MDISSRTQRVPVLRTQRRPCGTARRWGVPIRFQGCGKPSACATWHSGKGGAIDELGLQWEDRVPEALHGEGAPRSKPLPSHCQAIAKPKKGARAEGTRSLVRGWHSSSATSCAPPRSDPLSMPINPWPTSLLLRIKKSAARKHAPLGKGMAILRGDFLRPFPIRHLVIGRASLADGAIVPLYMRVDQRRTRKSRLLLVSQAKNTLRNHVINTAIGHGGGTNGQHDEDSIGISDTITSMSLETLERG